MKWCGCVSEVRAPVRPVGFMIIIRERWATPPPPQMIQAPRTLKLSFAIRE